MKKKKNIFILVNLSIAILSCIYWGINKVKASSYYIDENFHQFDEEYIPLSELNKMSTEEIMSLSSYDSTDYGLVTMTEEQTGRNTCWSYGTAAASATSILREGLTKKSADDFRISADNIAYTTFNRTSFNDPLGNTQYDTIDSVWNQGSHIDRAAKRLMQWNGPITISTLDNSFGAEFFKEPDFLLENYEIIDGNDRESIKKAIATYGAVATLYDSYATYASYYNSVGATPTAAHAVAIIGWNDNLPPSVFEESGFKRPSEPGGWLIKNSWGEYYGYYGYFYLSYESPIGNAISFDYEKNLGNRNNYFYDGLVDDSGLYIPSNNVAAIFRAKKASNNKKEILDGANVTVSGKDITINVNIYTDVNSNFGNRYSKTNNPESGNLVASGSRVVSHSGAYTVKLDKEIELLPDQNFSVVVSIESSYKDSYIVSSMEYESLNDMTFYKEDGIWKNCYNINSSVARIKAFTRTEEKKDTNSFNIKDAEIKLTESRFILGKDVFTPDVLVSYNGNKLERDKDYTLEYLEHKGGKDAINELLGYYEIVIEGKGKYKGVKKEYYQLKTERGPNVSAFGNYGPWGGEIEIYLDSTYNDFNEIVLPKNWEFKNKNGALSLGDNENYLIYTGQDKDIYAMKEIKTYVIKKDYISEDINDSKFTLVNEDLNHNYKYYGVPVTPHIALYKDGYPLQFNTEYGVDYINNNGAGIAEVIIYGKKNYKGTRTYSFNIEEKVQNDKVITKVILDKNSFVYNGKEQRPQITVYDNKDQVVNEKNYTVTFSKDLINSGIINIKIEGKENYKGELTTSYKIEKAENSINKLEIVDDNIIVLSKYGIPIIKYYGDKECKEEIKKPVNNGTYYVKVYVEESENTKYVEKIIEYTIKQEPIPLPDDSTNPDSSSSSDNSSDMDSSEDSNSSNRDNIESSGNSSSSYIGCGSIIGPVSSIIIILPLILVFNKRKRQ